ncbi:MAG: helix-turn-helix domain-containing protein [Rothia sp. (in: high G+C Gram-positive bacteria)]|nr:helix-turn-helix domain-containing protein [Rothia sp. (in: high G+C Gram-positive bacteria)]
MSALTLEGSRTIVPTPATASEARSLLEKIEGSDKLSITVKVSGARAEEIGSELLHTLKTALAIIGSGQKVEITALPQDLTTTVAAKRIGISRPTLMKLIREGKVPAHKVGSHFRFRTEDVDAYRVALLKEQTEKQEQAFNELRNLELDLGLTNAI